MTNEEVRPGSRSIPPERGSGQGGGNRGKTDLAVGLARSLLWAARHLQDLLNVVAKVPSPDPLQATGCFYSAVLLRAFAAEVALKGLYYIETGKQADRVHDLSKLFHELQLTTRKALERRFQVIRQSSSIFHGRPTTMEQVIADHKDDFVQLRYVYERQSDTHVELLDLEPAVEAIIAEYSDQLVNSREGPDGQLR